jgi:hypothetical protein
MSAQTVIATTAAIFFRIQFMIGSFSCLSSSSKAVDIRPTFALLKQLKNKKARNGCVIVTG